MWQPRNDPIAPSGLLRCARNDALRGFYRDPSGGIPISHSSVTIVAILTAIIATGNQIGAVAPAAAIPAPMATIPILVPIAVAWSVAPDTTAISLKLRSRIIESFYLILTANRWRPHKSEEHTSELQSL